ncbi:unnamed protein product [Ilex paraguariensis]|uniref:Protein CYCLOPS n=1 Tax=Ilex paraguariensis TaxID=185542 RepID=A0ABC8RXE0_9AQUA
MEGRSYSDFYRNTSEELFIKTMMEGSIGMPAPTMEMLGFKNLSNNFRTDSEELFKSWLTNGENNVYNPATIAHHTRSRRMFSEVASLSNQQQGGSLQRKRSNEAIFSQNSSGADEPSTDLSQHSFRNPVERGLQGINLYLAKAWFHSSQPMTRNRSSELRRKYVAMQNCHSSLGMETEQNISGHGVNHLKQEFADPSGLDNTSIRENPNQFNTFMSPTNSSSSTLNTPQIGTIDKVSSVVSMLKGTLERKKFSNQIEKEAIEDSSLGYYGAQEVLGNNSLNEEQGNYIHEAQGIFQDVCTFQLKDSGVSQTVGGSLDFYLEGFVAPPNQSNLQQYLEKRHKVNLLQLLL